MPNHVSRLITLACLAATLPAQLAGDYTIDPSGTGTRNFKSFGAANQALFTQRVKGSARFTAAAGTFKESISIGYPGGPVTFRGSPPGTKIDGRFGLNQATHLVLDGLDFLRGGGLSGQGNDIEIRNVRLSGRIRLKGNSFDVNHCQLQNCRMEIEGSNVDFRQNVCTVNSTYSPAIEVTAQPPNYVDRVRIAGNLITGNGMAISFGLMTRGDGVNIWHNTISVNPTYSRPAIAFGTNRGSRWASVYNNIIQVSGTGGGITIYGSGYVEFEANLYDIQSGVIGNVGAKKYTQLRDWQRALSKIAKNGKYDQLSLDADPVFAGAKDYHLNPRSPAVDYAVVDPKSNNGGSPLLTDLAGLWRGDMHDLGAYEFAGHRFFGAGCPGTGGRTPFLDVQGDVGPGKLVRFALSQARPSAPAVCALGLQRTTISLGGACTLLTSPLVVLLAPVSKLGETSIQYNMPRNQRVGGPDFYLQFGVLDAGAGGLGIAFSRGVMIEL